MDLTVLILARNEAKSLVNLIPEIQTAIETIPGAKEILVVDGNSNDNTKAVCIESGARVLTQKELGYGAAFREGIHEAQGKYICSIDADGSHNPFYLRQLYSHRKEAAVIIGSRYCFQGHYQGQLFRHILSNILNMIFSRALSIPVRDMSSGFRLYRKDLIDSLPLVGNDFDVLEELLVHVWAKGYKTLEIPIHFIPRKEGSSKARLVTFAWSYIKTLYRLWKLRNSLASADYDDRAFYSPLLPQRWWQRKRYSTVLSFCKGNNEKILDAGCGSSKILAAMPQAVGLDYNLSKLRFRKITNTRLARGDCCRLPFKDEVFDLAISSQVIEHLTNPAKCLDELTRTLKKNGILIVGTPDYARLLWRITEWFYQKILPHAYADEHVSHFSRQSLFESLETRGFVIEDFAYVFGGELIVKAKKTSEISIAKAGGVQK